jgi:hypothetical protein
MQILSKTIKLTGTEREDIVIGIKLGPGLVIVLENRGPATVQVKDIGPIEPNRFVIIGEMDELKIHPPGQLTTVDVTAFTK